MFPSRLAVGFGAPGANGRVLCGSASPTAVERIEAAPTGVFMLKASCWVSERDGGGITAYCVEVLQVFVKNNMCLRCRTSGWCTETHARSSRGVRSCQTRKAGEMSPRRRPKHTGPFDACGPYVRSRRCRRGLPAGDARPRPRERRLDRSLARVQEGDRRRLPALLDDGAPFLARASAVRAASGAQRWSRTGAGRVCSRFPRSRQPMIRARPFGPWPGGHRRTSASSTGCGADAGVGRARSIDQPSMNLARPTPACTAARSSRSFPRRHAARSCGDRTATRRINRQAVRLAQGSIMSLKYGCAGERTGRSPP